VPNTKINNVAFRNDFIATVISSHFEKIIV